MKTLGGFVGPSRGGRARGIVAVIALEHGAGNAEIALPIGHLGQMHIDAVGREKS